MIFEEMSVNNLQKYCKLFNIKLTNADGSRKLKNDLIKSLNSNKSTSQLVKRGTKRTTRSSSIKTIRGGSKSRIGSRRGSRSKSRRGSRRGNRVRCNKCLKMSSNIRENICNTCLNEFS